ncbi:MAG: DUF1697 domain-containing protein [Acidobacteria bacterium]|nr:DUF1697 domain-containing protein [Acidobacteriota bacterium]
MPRYVAFLRGVTPSNASMPDLKRAFERAGFDEVKTVLSSGNVVFTASAAPEATLVRQCEEAMATHLPRAFSAIVRATTTLAELLESDPYAAFDLPTDAKRVVTFLRKAPPTTIALPIRADGVQILERRGREVFTAYVPGPAGPVFMKMIEQTFGKDLTTRTWDTIRKCTRA